MKLFDFLKTSFYQETSENKSLRREKETTQNIFQNISTTNFFHKQKNPPTDSKEKLAQTKKISEEKSLPNKFQ